MEREAGADYVRECTVPHGVTSQGDKKPSVSIDLRFGRSSSYSGLGRIAPKRSSSPKELSSDARSPMTESRPFSNNSAISPRLKPAD